MSIQFRCPGCSQPIEVDDPFAGKSAQCPYCRRVITVPEKTSLDAASLAEARPSPDAPQSSAPMPPLPPAAGGSYGSYSPDPYGRLGQHEQRQPIGQDRGWAGAALVTGNLALALTALTIIFFITCIIMMAPAFPLLARASASQPATPQQAEQIIRDSGINLTALTLISSGMQFCLMAGLILGVISWWQKPTSNWRAWTSVGVNGVFVVCACSALVISIAVAAAGAR